MVLALGPRFLDRGRTRSVGGVRALFAAACCNIRVPSLLVRGQLSDVVTDAGVRSSSPPSPGRRLVDVGDAAHMVAGDQNDVFSRAVVEFLDDDIRPRCPDGRQESGQLSAASSSASRLLAAASAVAARTASS